jgi:trk system potassium uptake protein
MINYFVITRVLGVILMIIGGLMFTPIPFALYYNENLHLSFIYSGSLTLTIGFLMSKLFWLKSTSELKNDIKKRDGYLIVTLTWILMAFFGTLPYLFTSSIPNLSNAFFETISGFSTTGASILNNIEEMPKSILFWRSLSQWIGGLGIIVMTIAILPILGIGGMELFIAESPGPTSDKIHPRIKETAKRLWGIYVLLTTTLIALLYFGGMTFFDSFNHALTTISSGGFSTKQDSIAYFDSAFIQYVIIIFMFFAGTNFSLIYFGFKGQISRFWDNDEFMSYLKIIFIITIIITIGLSIENMNFEEKYFRDSLFQVLAIVTTTGFATADYTLWSPFIVLIFFLLLFFGGSAGSTSGGIKIVRHITLAKTCFNEFKRLLHPRAIITVKLNGYTVMPNIISNVLVFILIYLIVFVVSSLTMSIISPNLDFESTIGAVATCLGNVGPGLGSVGPSGNFNHVSDLGKWFLSFLMIVGRLELFTVLIIFTPYFWKD